MRLGWPAAGVAIAGTLALSLALRSEPEVRAVRIDNGVTVVAAAPATPPRPVPPHAATAEVAPAPIGDVPAPSLPDTGEPPSIPPGAGPETIGNPARTGPPTSANDGIGGTAQSPPTAGEALPSP